MRDFPLAVVEAKANYKSAADAVQQARSYAEMLGLKFAYATNGHDIIEIDYFTGKETHVTGYATPADLWKRYQACRLGRGIVSSDPVRVTRIGRSDGDQHRKAKIHCHP